MGSADANFTLFECATTYIPSTILKFQPPSNLDYSPRHGRPASALTLYPFVFRVRTELSRDVNSPNIDCHNEEECIMQYFFVLF